MVNLNTTLLTQLRFAFPPADEQQEIACRVAEADKAILRETSRLSKSIMIKVGLMKDLLNGRIRVPESVSENTP